MKMLSITLSKLRNPEHFQFLTEYKKIVERFGADILRFVKLFVAFMKLYETEDECMVILQKSEFTEKRSEADQVRDETFRGLRDAVNSALKHFDAVKRDAAKRLKILLDKYGNLAAKPLDEETSGIYNLVQDLQGKYVADVTALAIGDWVTELKANNEAYIELTGKRDTETAEKPEEKMKTLRPQIDDYYRRMIKAVEVFEDVSEDEEEQAMYKKFANELNAVIKRYNTRINRRGGGSDSENDTDDGTDELDNNE